MNIGTYYYPEQWPRDQWERDFDNIERMGLEIVHMGEFAWYQMESAEGQINLDWLSECVEMAAKRELKVILCTPTAAPPIWLVEKNPEILPTDHLGRPGRFGGRRHYNPLAPAMVLAAKRIVTAMADRFGQHPAVIGWQIDNEYGGAFDQSLLTTQVFQSWLEERYGTIEALNVAWGNQFWNTYYTDFSQIQMPYSRDPQYANPHHRLDASRFWSWAFAEFNKVQSDILKPRIGNRFITTNLMPLHADVSPDDLAPDLSLFSWDLYPVGFVHPTGHVFYNGQGAEGRAEVVQILVCFGASSIRAEAGGIVMITGKADDEA
jgi:beta-galactosidase